MKTKLYLLSLIAISALASCASVNKKVPVSFKGAALTKVESSQTEKLSKAITDYRAAKGLPELRRHAGLDRLAQEHCEYMRKHRGTFGIYGKNISHMGDCGRSLIAIKRFGMMNSSENVAWTEKFGSEAKTSRRFVKMWSESPNHDWAMSGEGWTHTGIGTVVDDDGSVFATQLFCTKNSSHLSSRELFYGF